MEKRLFRGRSTSESPMVVEGMFASVTSARVTVRGEENYVSGVANRTHKLLPGLRNR